MNLLPEDDAGNGVVRKAEGILWLRLRVRLDVRCDGQRVTRPPRDVIHYDRDTMTISWRNPRQFKALGPTGARDDEVERYRVAVPATVPTGASEAITHHRDRTSGIRASCGFH